MRHDASCPTKANFGTKRCQKCGGCSKPEDSLTNSLLDFEKLILYILGIISYRNIFLVIIFLMIFAFVLFGSSFFYRYVPYKRIKGYKEKDRKMPLAESLTEQILFYAHIAWKCSKWRIFKFWSSKLLIIIAVDENNQPISHPLCVRIRKCKTGYELTKIMRILKFDKKACKRFFVYWGDELVGEGTVISKFYL